ncbi:hypothetical protein GCM10017673_32970 [Streptosporangium violaceochromogenes]|nr:hypothetical protein GCM10017673_32970 [Streptosporangium violaceochromogenes]
MQKFIRLLESQLGYSERGGRTKFGEWYGGEVEFDADYGAAPWCDMYLSWAAKKLGYEEWVGQFAYTVHHARWFQRQDAWGTVPRPGAIVFFDWSGSKKIGGIDHVGIVTRVEGTTIHTIEGNIDGGVAKRKQRGTDKVVGYGYPEKIKARLEREAARKQEIVTSEARADGRVTLGLGPGSSTTAPVRETVPPSPVPAPAPRHARPDPAAARTASPAEAGRPSPGSRKKAEHTPATAAGAQSRAGTAGKHAKPAAADTNAVAAAPAPVATGHDVSPDVSQIGTPAVLAPVLLAALALIVHTKARQTRGRPALAARVATGRRPHRARSHRRAPGRRRAFGGASPPLETAPAAPAASAAPVLSAPVLAETRGAVRQAVPEITLAPAGAAGFPSLTSPISHVEESHAGDPAPGGPAPAAFRLGDSRTGGLRPELISLAGETFSTGLAHAGNTPAPRRSRGTHAGGTAPADRRRDDSPTPYQGRRRRRGRPVAESSTFVQDAPLRGRRHRRPEAAVSTTMQAVPATRAARGRAGVSRVAEVSGTSGVPGSRDVAAGTVASPAAEPGDVLVHSGYRGRRRARIPA